MIKWYDNLYVDCILKNKQKKIMKKIDEGKITTHVYCIALASNGNNLFDIINTNELLFKYYKNQEMCILGLAFGRDSAIELVVSMIEEIYKNTGDFKVRNYYKFE